MLSMLFSFKRVWRTKYIFCNLSKKLMLTQVQQTEQEFILLPALKMTNAEKWILL